MDITLDTHISLKMMLITFDIPRHEQSSAEQGGRGGGDLHMPDLPQGRTLDDDDDDDGGGGDR